ncbi:MAG TPA: hypothetical protein VFN22_03280 [Gemmatimonadales bacterium]|nr:hypothetical protein [Gemmatimonadales bacterium]
MLRIFTGTRLPTVLSEVRRTLGEQACIVDVQCDADQVEVLAAEVAVTVHPFQAPVHDAPLRRTALDGPDPLMFGGVLRATDPEARPAPRPVSGPAATTASAPRAARPSRDAHPIRPPVIALVGPTGAGKTTTLAKLATNPRAYGRQRVGVIGLDTYRIGAVEQLETYAELAGLPCEIVYELADLDRALARLVECDVILVDTPGRGPRQSEDLETVRHWLAHLEPDEVHLALPASIMPHVMRRTMTQFERFGVTHMLCTKLDECPIDSRVFDVVAGERHTMRWYTDGQDVPTDLRDATSRLEAAVERRAARRVAQEVFA